MASYSPCLGDLLLLDQIELSVRFLGCSNTMIIRHEYDGSDEKQVREMGRALDVNGEALSLEDWNYIRGLFLADGCFFTRIIRDARRVYGAQFCFGQNEEEIALRLAEKFKKVGLKPSVKKLTYVNMVRLTVCSKLLRLFLPDKSVLLSDFRERERFFDLNKLLHTKFGIPFFAGLLDGDGYCGVQIDKRRTFFAQMNQWLWSFSQRKYAFLVEYVKQFLGSLAPNSSRTWVRSSTGVVTVVLHKCAIEALLRNGIASFSWRATRWLQKVAEFQNNDERAKYYTSREVSQLTGVGYGVIRRWIKTGRIRCVRKNAITRKKTRLGKSNFYFPILEVKRLQDEVLNNQRKVTRLRNECMKLADASKMLGVSYELLRSLYRRGKIQAFLVRDERAPDGRYLMVPESQINMLKLMRANNNKYLSKNGALITLKQVLRGKTRTRVEEKPTGKSTV